MDHTLKIVLRFAVQLTVGSFLFLLVLAAAIAIWKLRVLAEGMGAPQEIVLMATALEWLMMAVDAICFAWFLLVELCRFIRDTW